MPTKTHNSFQFPKPLGRTSGWRGREIFPGIHLQSQAKLSAGLRARNKLKIANGILCGLFILGAVKNHT